MPNVNTLTGRFIRGLRSVIPSGYILGRTSSGDGPVELLKLSDISGAQPGGKAGGDLAGSYPAPTVVKLRGNAIKNQNPLGSGQDMYVLAWVNSAGDLEMTPLSTVLDKISSTRGAMLYRGNSGWAALLPGTAGNVLKDGGTGADPSWATISAILDGISSTRGAVLYRGASGWAALSPNTAGYVLTDGGSGADPSWAAVSGGGAPKLDRIMDRWPLDLVNGGGGGGGGGGGSTYYSWAWPNGILSATDDSTSNACKGTIVLVMYNFSVTVIRAYMTTVAGVNYRGAIYEVNSSSVIQSLVAESNDVAPGAVSNAIQEFPLTTTAALQSGKYYAITVRRTDANTNSCTIKGQTSQTVFPNLPVTPIYQKYARLAKASPAVSDTFTVADGYEAVGVRFYML